MKLTETSLNGYLDLSDRIAEQKGKIDRMNEVAYDPPSGMREAKQKNAGHGDGQRPVVDSMVDLERALEKMEREREDAKAEIVTAINRLEDARVSRMLYDFYIKGESTQEIALNERISYSHASNLLHWGVERIKK